MRSSLPTLLVDVLKTVLGSSLVALVVTQIRDLVCRRGRACKVASAFVFELRAYETRVKWSSTRPSTRCQADLAQEFGGRHFLGRSTGSTEPRARVGVAVRVSSLPPVFRRSQWRLSASLSR